MSHSRYHQLNALGMIAAMLLAAMLLLADRWYTERNALTRDIEVQASLIGSNAVAALAFNDTLTAMEIVGTATRSPLVLEAVLYDAKQQRMAQFTRSQETAQLPAEKPEISLQRNFSELILTTPIEQSEQVLGYITVRADMRPLYRELARFLVGLIAIAGIAFGFARFATRGVRERIREAEAALHQMALYDKVSQLSNRFSFEQDLARTVNQCARGGKGAALLFIDVDGFKKVNDTLGHQAGDQVLAEIGSRLKQSLRSSDIIARIGGDEFAVILIDTPEAASAAQIAASLIRVAAMPFQIGTATAHIGFSIGIAMLPGDGQEAQTLMSHADQAMYHVKQHSKGNYQFFSADIAAGLQQRLATEQALRRAMRNGELQVVYQPQVLCQSEALCGLEALLRWQDPERGLIAPAEFIPVAEECGLILEIGQQVLDMVCHDIRQLKDAGYEVPPVAINLSAKQFMLGDLLADLRSVTQRYALPPSAIELELTESVLMDRLEARRGLLDQLSAAGFRLAIDDFGTGYSSLSYLRHLKVDKLKIDMSFIHALPADGDSLAIIHGIISMAHAIGLTVIAEGVESAAQLKCLQASTCDQIQGFQTGQPMSLAMLQQRLKQPTETAAGLAKTLTRA